MANIAMRKRKDGTRTFMIRCTVKGTSYARTYPSKDEDPIPETWSDKRARKEAEKVAALFEDACRHGSVSNDRRTVTEYVQYVVDLKEQTKAIKPSTVAGYITILNRMKCDPISKIRIRDLSVSDLNSYYSRLMGEGANLRNGKPLAPKTVREHHALLSSVLSQAKKEHIISFDPSEEALVPTIEQKPANFYTVDEMSKIIDAVSGESTFWKAMTYLFIGVGARRGEILALQWADVNFEDGRIFIRRNLTRGKMGRPVLVTPKSNRWRLVSIAEELLAPLKEWKAEQEAMLGEVTQECFCFAQIDPEKPIHPDSVTKHYARLGVKFKIGHVNPHAFRHSQASVILKDGDIVSASQRLGHSKPSTTMNIYGHMLPATDKVAAENIKNTFLQAKDAKPDAENT